MKSIAKSFEHQITDDMDFRRPVLVGLIVFVLLFLSWHTIAEAEFGFSSLAYLEGAFALYSAVLLFFVLRKPYSRWLACAFVLPAIAVILAAMFHPQTPSNVYLWTFLFPILTYALLGRQPGLVVTFIATVLALGAYLSKTGDITVGSHFLVMTDVVICLSIIWVVVHLYERYREKTVEAFHRLATTDELTGLQNRRQMEKAFTHLSKIAERQQQVLAVVVMDLDHFKQINDRWGHDAGDAVLIHISKLLQECLRKSDWAFRIGGEEFCLLLQVETPGGATKVAETIRRLIESTPCYYEGREIALSASIGVAMYPEEEKVFEKLLQRADEYMYHAKENGRNRVVDAAVKSAF